MIQSWNVNGIRLEEDGLDGATIVNFADGGRIVYGDITWNRYTNVHVIKWNADGRRAFTRPQRESWDDLFYYAMAGRKS
ncbi:MULTISPECIES: hypothetical protein [Actinomycetes]|uniref:Uncharacterized protein n=2 Tax=Actinomycetes TaxID=1760 RepID=A0ABU2AI28_9ACTN|nr:hypothetical protein [Glycomyces lechevalierae]MDR7336871.1 hypothetical protein [Glycomyces lechevalierae]